MIMGETEAENNIVELPEHEWAFDEKFDCYSVQAQVDKKGIRWRMWAPLPGFTVEERVAMDKVIAAQEPSEAPTGA